LAAVQQKETKMCRPASFIVTKNRRRQS